VAAVLTCLARLPDDQRAVVRLRFLEDVAVGEIAKRLGKNEMAVYQRCHRGLEALRTLLSAVTSRRTSV
jgi:RNA polymerase sigma factor (sigma-70 family)